MLYNNKVMLQQQMTFTKVRSVQKLSGNTRLKSYFDLTIFWVMKRIAAFNNLKTRCYKQNKQLQLKNYLLH